MACSCNAVTICELVQKADVILVAEVIQGGLEPGEDAWSGRPRSATLRIIESFKGVPTETHEITVSLMYLPGMCSPAVYRRGERTLAFLGWSTKDGTLQDGACSGSQFVKDAGENLEYVRAYFAGRAQTTISGKVAANESSDLVSFALRSPEGTPVQGALITADGAGGRFSANTNERGEYRFAGLPEGTYAVTAAKTGYSSTDPDKSDPASFSVKVNDRNCAFQDLGLWTQNSVTGTVRDAAGQPIVGINVFLQKVDGDPDLYGKQARTDRNGQFKFVRIDPRPHYLVVSPFGATPDSPYETRLLGGVDVRSRAQVLNIDAASDLRSRDIILGNRIATRSIRIQLEWADGQTVSNAFIRCGDARMTDERHFGYAKGRSEFVCDALADRPYRVRVARIETNMDLRDTPDVVVPAGNENTTVTIRVGPQDTIASKRRP